MARFDQRTEQWREAPVEDRTAGPAQIAETRIDFASWLSTVSNRERRLAEKLAFGETTGCVARTFRISAGRVSQLDVTFVQAGTGSWANWRRSVATA